jgi:hypothetical protein
LSPYAEVVDTFTDPATGETSRRKLSIVADAEEYPQQVKIKSDNEFGMLLIIC